MTIPAQRPSRASNRETCYQLQAAQRAALRADDVDRKITGLWRPRRTAYGGCGQNGTGTASEQDVFAGLRAVLKHNGLEDLDGQAVR